MATYHTDYLLGNDTTGDGSAALPWKTITRAYTTAITNDTIKVAGSTIADVPSLTLTCTNSINGNYTSNIDATGLIAAGDVISLTHPEFGADKFFFRVHSVAGTAIVLNCGITTGIAMAVRKFNQIHYATTSSVLTFEAPTTGTKTGLQITGGWNSTFTTQDGWTVVRFQGASQTAQGATFMSSASPLDTYYEKFCFVQLSTGFGGGTALTQYYGDLIGSRTASMFGAYPRNKVGYKPNWYMNISNCQGGTSTIINNDGTYGLNIANFYTVLTQSNNQSWSNCGFSIDNVYIDSYSDSFNTSNNGIIPTTQYATIGDIYLYSAANSPKLYAGNANILWNGRLFITGPAVSTTRISTGNYQIGSIMWNNPTQNVSNFRYWSSTNAPLWSSENLKISIIDSEGTKVLNSSGLLYVDTTDYVTGTNSLRIDRCGGQTGKSRLQQFVVNSGSTSLTITMTAKSTVSSSESFSIMGFGVSRAITLANRTIGTSWATYTWTITGDDLTTLKNKIAVFYWNTSVGTGNIKFDDVVITQS